MGKTKALRTFFADMIVVIGSFELILIVQHDCTFLLLCLLAFCTTFARNSEGQNNVFLAKHVIHMERKGVVCCFAFMESVGERRVRP